MTTLKTLMTAAALMISVLHCAQAEEQAKILVCKNGRTYCYYEYKPIKSAEEMEAIAKRNAEFDAKSLKTCLGQAAVYIRFSAKNSVALRGLVNKDDPARIMEVMGRTEKKASENELLRWCKGNQDNGYYGMFRLVEDALNRHGWILDEIKTRNRRE